MKEIENSVENFILVFFLQYILELDIIFLNHINECLSFYHMIFFLSDFISTSFSIYLSDEIYYMH